MITILKNYLKNEISPRAKYLMVSGELACAVIAILFASYFTMDGSIDDDWVRLLLNPLLVYSTITFGFCIISLSLVISGARVEFLKVLSHTEISYRTDAYSHFLFVSSWAALFHWLLIFYILAILAVYRVYNLNKHVITIILAGLATYCLCQILTVLINIFRCGKVYLEDLQK